MTVINVQQNAIDSLHPTLTLGTGTVPGLGPVHAALYQPAGLLVTANYDSNTITVINVGLDIYGNDGPIFGETHTVPVGKGPVAVTILQDGSRAYVANQIDGTVSVVNLTSFVVTSTIPVFGGAHPDAIASVSGIGTGAVFVLAKDSQYITAIRTDTDQVSANIFLQSFGMALRSTTETAGGPSNSATAHERAVQQYRGQPLRGAGYPVQPGARSFAILSSGDAVAKTDKSRPRQMTADSHR